MMEAWIDGVVADLGHLEKPANVKGFAIDPSKLAIDQLEECLTEVDLRLVLASAPRKADMTRDNLININLDIETGIVESATHILLKCHAWFDVVLATAEMDNK